MNSAEEKKLAEEAGQAWALKVFNAMQERGMSTTRPWPFNIEHAAGYTWAVLPDGGQSHLLHEAAVNHWKYLNRPRG